MLAFFCLIGSKSAGYETYRGTLFDLPVELRDKLRVRNYEKINKDGWSKDEFGYSVFSLQDDNFVRYIIPGLYIKDEPAPRKKFHGHRPSFNKSDIEGYLNSHISRNKLLVEKSENELSALVHDLRQLSSSIYHSAVEARLYLDQKDFPSLREAIKTIIATQTMLKVRTDFLDFSGSSGRFDEIENVDIPVYSRVDKVVRCFRAAAKSKKISINIEGPSYNQANGPNILDLVPYVIIDNAIKYSPKGCNIDVKINDYEAETIVCVRSRGPVISEEEKDNIFRRGYRGFQAKLHHSMGTGIGLSVAKDIVDLFGGSIDVLVGGGGVGNVESGICDIEFVFKIPSR